MKISEKFLMKKKGNLKNIGLGKKDQKRKEKKEKLAEKLNETAKAQSEALLDAQEANRPINPGRKWAQVVEQIKQGTLQSVEPAKRTNRRIETQKEVMKQKDILSDPDFQSNPISAFAVISQQLEAKIAAQNNS